MIILRSVPWNDLKAATDGAAKCSHLFAPVAAKWLVSVMMTMILL